VGIAITGGPGMSIHKHIHSTGLGREDMHVKRCREGHEHAHHARLLFDARRIGADKKEVEFLGAARLVPSQQLGACGGIVGLGFVRRPMAPGGDDAGSYCS
jgi:hypothetical protein